MSKGSLNRKHKLGILICLIRDVFDHGDSLFGTIADRLLKIFDFLFS